MQAKLRRATNTAAWSAIALAAFSSVIALTVRDAWIPTAMVFFGVPWLARLVLLAAAFLTLRPRGLKTRMLCAAVAVHSLIQAGQSFHWREAAKTPAAGFDVTLWNTGRNLSKMPREWPRLAGPDTKLVVLIEAGSFPGDTWKRFTATRPDFTWRQLDGGIVVGVKGKLIDVTALGDRPRFRCHRIRAEINGALHTVCAVDIPSQPWLPRDPFLKRILDVSGGGRCMILGDFNTPPSARGFDSWRNAFSLANEARTRGFGETWCYGVPLLELDQLWLGKDLQCAGVTQTATLRSDHVRMSFRIGPR